MRHIRIDLVTALEGRSVRIIENEKKVDSEIVKSKNYLRTRKVKFGENVLSRILLYIFHKSQLWPFFYHLFYFSLGGRPRLFYFDENGDEDLGMS